jgi:hypothetical protein
MRKIFHFDSAPEPYVADAAVICCFDHRINLAVRKFLQRRSIVHPDMIVVAGGAKALASPRHDFERDFVLDQIQLSRSLHTCGRVILLSHSDCGAYGGLGRFQGNCDAESVYHQSELGRASKLVEARLPDMRVETYFVNFEGMWESNQDTGEESRAIA